MLDHAAFASGQVREHLAAAAATVPVAPDPELYDPGGGQLRRLIDPLDSTKGSGDALNGLIMITKLIARSSSLMALQGPALTQDSAANWLASSTYYFDVSITTARVSSVQVICWDATITAVVNFRDSQRSAATKVIYASAHC